MARSLLFNLLFYVTTTLFVVLGSPLLFAPRSWAMVHFVGANERFISREFERHFLGLGVRAGLMGAFAAAIAFLLLPVLTHMLGGGIVTTTETERLIGSGELDLAGYSLCILVVFVVACLCMVTSRLGVIRVLKSYE